MIRYVNFNDLELEHLVCVANSIMAAPLDKRLDANDILDKLKSGVFRAFSFGHNCLIIVSKQDHKLLIECFTGNVFKRKDLAADLRRLAADWECDMVETLVYDSRLAHAIEKVGGHCESWLMTLAVEG